MGGIAKFVDEKRKLVERLGRKLSGASVSKALKDGHAKRRPRPCGLTVHTGVGCSFACIYCYIYDMGFTSAAKPYPLSAAELAYAVASNPYVALGKEGLMLAFGSVTEPFLPETYRKAIEYLEAASGLGNPSQFSTKQALSLEQAREVKKANSNASALVTIVTLKKARVLEPLAPTPAERVKTIANLSKAGLHTCLFLRPVIPGLTEKEARDILEAAASSGAAGVVLGSLRVTERIANALLKLGMDVRGRVPRWPKGREQLAVASRDLKEKVEREAQRLGLEVFKSACAANIQAHELSCYACAMGP
ncbi:TPA: radical SAM protein, partial [Candidatus Micrarchaeota archaeon]|nr:radical SAM protein [Candidatus Micrarchaeota archaeon]